MPIHKLDASFCLLAQCAAGKKKTDFYDSVVRGFTLECRSSGGKTYYLRYDQDGRQRQHKIAAYGDITFDKARKEAMRLRSEVTLGVDPSAKKQERRAVPTYAELADDHVKHARTYMRSIKTLEGYMTRIRKRWGKLRLTDIHQQDVATWLAQLRSEGLAPATVEKVRVIMSRSFQLGAQWGIAGCDRNPVRGVPKPKFDNARQRYLSSEEAARLIAAAGKVERSPRLAEIVSLLLFAGMRVSELLSARWENLDREARTLFIPMSKTGRSRHVPLSQAALDVIAQLPKANGAIFLFPSSKRPKMHITSIKHGWQAAREAAGLPELRIHDLRHSAASFMVNAGVDLFAVGKVLGHATYQSTQRYSHLANDTLLAAVEAGARKQLRLASA